MGRIAKPAKRQPVKKPVTKAASRKVKWDEVEGVLLRLCTRALKAFAEQHPDEIFYALFIDFAADWTQIRLHLSTPAILRLRAQEYIRANPEHYARRSPEAVANEIRWEPGDFGYFEINNTRGWKQVWSPYAKKLAAAAAKQQAEDYASGDFVELQFLLTVSRVLLRLEGAGALDVLKRTRNFRVCCMRPEERPEDAWRRLDLLHRQMVSDENAARRSAPSPGRARRPPARTPRPARTRRAE